MYGKIFLCALLIAAVALSGCSGPTATPAPVNDGAKQSAYSDYLAKSHATAQYEDVPGQAGDLLRDMNYSDVHASLKAIDGMSSRLGGYLAACEQSRASAEEYRAYVDRNSSEYGQLMAYDTSMGDNIMAAQGLNDTLADDRAMLNVYDGWQQEGDRLGTKLGEYRQFRYGDEMYRWFQQVQPQMEAFLSDGARASSAIDNVMAETPAGPGRDSLAGMKEAINAKEDKLRQDYNALILQYDATFGPAYGSMPSI